MITSQGVSVWHREDGKDDVGAEFDTEKGPLVSFVHWAVSDVGGLAGDVPV